MRVYKCIGSDFSCFGYIVSLPAGEYIETDIWIRLLSHSHKYK